MNRDAAVRERRWSNRTLARPAILLLAIPLLLGASPDKWVVLADGDLSFARKMAAAGARFDREFFDDVVDRRIPHFGDRSCLVYPSTLAGLPSSQVARIQWFSQDYCEPWNHFWARELQRCRGWFAPGWCNDQDREQDLTRHLEIKAYFEHLAAALESERGPLQRFNILEVAASRLTVWPLAFYPKRGLCALMVRPVSVFLEDAPVENALIVGARLGVNVLGGPCSPNGELAEAFRAYRDRADRITDEQRGHLDEVIHSFKADTLSIESAQKLRRLFSTPTPPEKPLDPAEFKTDPAASALLLARVRAHYESWRDGNIAMLWDEQCLDARAGTDRGEFDRAMRWDTKEVPVVTSHVRNAKVVGNLARVVSDVTYAGSGKHRGAGEHVHQEISYWIFEDDNWFTWNLGAVDPDNAWMKQQDEAVDVTFPEGTR